LGQNQAAIAMALGMAPNSTAHGEKIDAGPLKRVATGLQGAPSTLLPDTQSFAVITGSIAATNLP
jgi:hypothetical protein